MKRRMSMVVLVALVAGLSGGVLAKSVRKNAPRKKAVEADLKKIGGDHYPERMRISEIGPIRVGETYYHAFCGQLKKVGYHVIIYDNELHYLGFYATDFEPTDYEEGAVLLDSGDGDTYYQIPITEKGPAKKVRLPQGLPIEFVPAPGQEIGKASTKKITPPPETKGKDGIKAEYRDWHITRKGKKMTIRAIYVKQALGTVDIKSEANGRVATIRLSELSREDQEYVKKFK